MKELLFRACKVFGLLLLVVALGSPARAQGNGNNQGGNNQGNDGGQVTAPELDPGAFLAALALLAGGTMILIDRRRS